LAVPTWLRGTREARGLRRSPRGQRERDRQPADVPATVGRRAVVAGRVEVQRVAGLRPRTIARHLPNSAGLGGGGRALPQVGGGRRAGRALVRPAVALAGGRVADRAGLDRRIRRAAPARTAVRGGEAVEARRRPTNAPPT